jgi:hypothetical protein
VTLRRKGFGPRCLQGAGSKLCPSKRRCEEHTPSMLQASTEHAAGMPQVPKCFELRLIFISREMYLESSAIVVLIHIPRCRYLNRMASSIVSSSFPLSSREVRRCSSVSLVPCKISHPSPPSRAATRFWMTSIGCLFLWKACCLSAADSLGFEFAAERFHEGLNVGSIEGNRHEAPTSRWGAWSAIQLGMS